jgi:hypothetical protein
VNGYIEGGYGVCLATLTIYAATLLRRERSLRRRLPEGPGHAVNERPHDSGPHGSGPHDAAPHVPGPHAGGLDDDAPGSPIGPEGANDEADAGVGGH